MTTRIRDELSEYPYDPAKCTEEVELRLEDETFIKLAQMAHERDITLNHLMCAIIHQEIQRHTHPNFTEVADEISGDSSS